MEKEGYLEAAAGWPRAGEEGWPRAAAEGWPRAAAAGWPRAGEEGWPRAAEEGWPRAAEEGWPRAAAEGLLRAAVGLWPGVMGCQWAEAGCRQGKEGLPQVAAGWKCLRSRTEYLHPRPCSCRSQLPVIIQGC